MSNHHDDFWGDEATWSSRTAPTERFDDSSHSEFDAASHSTFDAGHTGPVDTEHTGPLDIVRKRWNRLLGSGSNATREHGIVRPSTVPNDIDATTTFGSPDEPASVWIDDEPTPLWNATMFDDIDHDAPTSRRTGCMQR